MEGSMDKDWRDGLRGMIVDEEIENTCDMSACKAGAIRGQIKDRIDALRWARRILWVTETRKKFAYLLERERDSNFRRHQRTRKSCYSTTAYALQWVLDKMGVTA